MIPPARRADISHWFREERFLLVEAAQHGSHSASFATRTKLAYGFLLRGIGQHLVIGAENPFCATPEPQFAPLEPLRIKKADDRNQAGTGHGNSEVDQLRSTLKKQPSSLLLV